MEAILRLLNYNINRNLHSIRSRCISRSNNLNETCKNMPNWRNELHNTMQIYPDFISEEEEDSLMEEINPYMRRLRYEISHWDDAIHGYRETEKKQWNESNTKILSRVREKAFPKEMCQLQLVHVLDLSAEGWIKPHVDSIKFCGDIIAGLSLLTDSIMKLTMVDYENECFDHFLLPRRSLYIMSGAARYKYNHEILKSEESYYQGQHIPKGRRISIICRTEPDRGSS